MAEKDLNLVGKLAPDERAIAEFRLRNISPDDAKYAEASRDLADFLSPKAEWQICAFVQRTLLEARVEFGQAEKRHLDEVDRAMHQISPLNMALLEEKVTKHDQLAVIEEIGRFVSPETKALLHPGTTSYDILDTARAYMFKRAWFEVIRSEISKGIEKLCDISQKAEDEKILQVGRTHLQDTSPVPFALTMAGYAGRIADRVELCDQYFSDLRGKVSGIVGTGASVEMVVAKPGKDSRFFEDTVLGKLGLSSDLTATQVTQKEKVADLGHGLTTLMHVLADFTNDMRMLYSSAIGEITSRDAAQRLGGSSADATKNNPIQYENMTGKAAVVESGMRVLYEMIHSDFQRDLRGSVQARYQPQAMMTQVYEAFLRLNKALSQLSINTDRMERNLQPVRDNPSEAMVAILRGKGFVHSQYGVGHDFVKEIGKVAKSTGRKLVDVALEDSEFSALYKTLPENHQQILQGRLENYVGTAYQRANLLRTYARYTAKRTFELK